MLIKEYRNLLWQILAPARRHLQHLPIGTAADADLTANIRETDATVIFRGSLGCTICKFLTLSPRGEAMTMQKSFGRPREDGKHTAYTHHQPCQLHGFVYVSRNSQLVSNFPLRSAMQAVSAHCRPTLHHQHLMCLYLEKNIVSIPAPRATPTMYKSVKMRGTPKQFMYVNWDPTIIVGSHLHNTSIQLHNVYFIFRLLKGWHLGHYFLNTSYSSPTHTLFWTHFTSSLSALMSILCIGTAELHVDLELLSILQAENMGALTPQM